MNFKQCLEHGMCPQVTPTQAMAKSAPRPARGSTFVVQDNRKSSQLLRNRIMSK